MKDLKRRQKARQVARDELEERVVARTRELEERLAARTNELSYANAALKQQTEALDSVLETNKALARRVEEQTAELRETQERSVELSRLAGMTEVASNVLHNVGNVLSSVSTSAVALSEHARALRVNRISKVAEMLEEHKADLASFLATDERGRMLPYYLSKLSKTLEADQETMLQALAMLLGQIDHIRAVIRNQQDHAQLPSSEEAVDIADLIEDALRMSNAGLELDDVNIERDFEPAPSVRVDKHKVLQILVNLISNAKYALAERERNERRLILRLGAPESEQVRIQVIDNGVGIDPALHTKIFQHGFTTRKGGHGFGLHASRIDAHAIGGSLEMHSDGVGHGATFTLVLPFHPADSR